MKSLPLAVKVGGSAIVGGGGITGAGLLIHHQLKSELTGLDKELVDEKTAFLEVDTTDSKFTVGSSSNNNQVTLKIKATSRTGNKFSGEKWTCTVKGIAKDDANNVPLNTSGTQNFNIEPQTTNFTGKLGEGKNKEKDGFVKSCARNRKEDQKTDSGWSSDLIVNLTKKTTPPNSSEYEFSEEAINSIFAGTWENPKQQ